MPSPSPRRTRIARTLSWTAFAAGIVLLAATVVAIVIPKAPDRPAFVLTAPNGQIADALPPGSQLISSAALDSLPHLPTAPADETREGLATPWMLPDDPETAVATLAAALDLDGPVRATGSDPVTYTVGPDDGTAPRLTVTWTGLGTWHYTDEAAEQTPTGSRPTLAQAREQAADLFSATGMPTTPEPGDLDTAETTQSLIVSAALTVDGAATGVRWWATWTTGETLGSAGGHLATPAPDRAVAVPVEPATADRFSDGRWQALGPHSIAVGDKTADTPPSPDAPQDGFTFDRPEPWTAPGTPDAVTAAPVVVWAVDGTAWLVPGWVLTFTDGTSTAAAALPGIHLPEPVPAA